MVPPPIREDLDAKGTVRLMKSPSFLTGVMRPLELRFRSPAFLSSLSLGALGTLIEWTIHGWMHVRWTHTTYDPATGESIGRGLFDVDPKWDDPSNDDLGDFYSSHVHPTFWRIHGWIDDRIQDWARANAGRVTTATVDGVPWFKADGKLVQVRDPFYWPAGGHHHHHGDGDDADVNAMEEVMAIMQEVLERPAPTAARVTLTGLGGRSAREVFTALLLGAGVEPDLGD